MSHYSFPSGQSEPVTMKHPSTNLEAFEFNLGNAPKLRCTTGEGTTDCGECESCVLTEKLLEIKEWFGRTGDQTQRRFVLGLVRRIHSADLLQYLSTILQPLQCKDFTYSRSRAKPSLDTDKGTMSADRALDPIKLEDDIAQAWQFFLNATYWTKSKFMLTLLHSCDAHLLYSIGNLARTILVTEQKAQVIEEDYELSSIPSSHYTFNTEDHPSLELLTLTSTCYSPIKTDPLGDSVHEVKKRTGSDDDDSDFKTPTSPTSPEISSEKSTVPTKSATSLESTASQGFAPVSDPRKTSPKRSPRGSLRGSGRKGSAARSHTPGASSDWGIVDDDGASMTSIHPACLVVPTSAKAHLGVDRYRDFVCRLPVHLAKKILGYLDKITLKRCERVTPWKHLVKEVQDEKVLSKRLKNEIALMQAVKVVRYNHRDAELPRLKKKKKEKLVKDGSSSVGCNPRYAADIDVAVPNVLPSINLCLRRKKKKKAPSSICGEEEESSTSEDSDEVSDSEYESPPGGKKGDLVDKGEKVTETTAFRVALRGFSTRRVIMESRNVYCGAYNVMVVINTNDPTRVVDTNQGPLVVHGSNDRRVRLVNSDTNKELEMQFTGHAGSIRCVRLCEEKQFVLSGSYDTSIRKWSLETGRCTKILRGHRDTIMCLYLYKDMLVSGAKDNLCKVWDVETGKCLHTFKMSGVVMAVCMNDKMVVAGDLRGKVKVWSLKTKSLLKVLAKHHGAVTSVTFDTWHIVSGGVDGLALCWSAQGDCDACLNKLRHPKEVLCVAMAYLRVITGAGDGKMRIWHMVDATCLRIIRGNSRSDPITQLIATHNRITINTCNNTVVYNFEPVVYDYSVKHDRPALQLQYGRYADVPVRQQEYPYVRAQRMARAGATNPKILHHGKDGGRGEGGRGEGDKGEGEEGDEFRARPRHHYQTPHSAKSLNERSMKAARRIQSARSGQRKKLAKSAPAAMHSRSLTDLGTGGRVSPRSTTAGTVRTRTRTAKSRGSEVPGLEDAEEAELANIDFERRVSWAYEHPFTPSGRDLDLASTKSLLRSQIRAKGKVLPPDFIYLKVNSIQQSMKDPADIEKQQQEIVQNRRFGRPSSSPSKIDTRSRKTLSPLEWKRILEEAQMISEDEGGSLSGESGDIPAIRVPTQTTIVTEFDEVPVAAKPSISLHSKKTKSTIPPPRLVRPASSTVHTAETYYEASPSAKLKLSAGQFRSAPDRGKHALFLALSEDQERKTAKTRQSISQPQRPKSGSRGHRLADVREQRDQDLAMKDMVPMLMYNQDVFTCIADMKQRRAERNAERIAESIAEQGGVMAAHNDPMRTNANFQLFTHAEEMQKIADVEAQQRRRQHRRATILEKKQRASWNARLAGKLGPNYMDTPAPSLTSAPELC